MNTQEMIDRITMLVKDYPMLLENLTKWLDVYEHSSELYTLRAEVNDSCSCHPEYTTIHEENTSLASVIRQAAACENDRSCFKVNVNDIRVERQLSEKELADATQLLSDTRQTITRERAARERNKKIQEMTDWIKRVKESLESDRKDLNAEAIARREQAIREKEQQLASL